MHYVEMSAVIYVCMSHHRTNKNTKLEKEDDKGWQWQQERNIRAVACKFCPGGGGGHFVDYTKFPRNLKTIRTILDGGGGGNCPPQATTLNIIPSAMNPRELDSENRGPERVLSSAVAMYPPRERLFEVYFLAYWYLTNGF